MSFETLGLSNNLLRAIRDTGYVNPTPIQVKAIPITLKGTDLMAVAQTGTGKTASFILPILHKLCTNKDISIQESICNKSRKKTHKPRKVRALMLAPTRELAMQVHDCVLKYGKYLQLKSVAVFGGVKIYSQIIKLRKDVDLVVATPGRLLDLYRQQAICFKSIEMFVMDEADRMLDMGFINDIKEITKLMPKTRQNLMFSATFSDSIKKLTKNIAKDPIEINVAKNNSTLKGIKQRIYVADKERKSELLCHLILKNKWHQVLVFTKTKKGADKLVKKLMMKKIKAEAIHGNKNQSQRSKALASFKQNKTQILVATDVAARGIDIQQLPYVVNFDLPHDAEDYIHRIGRTGRAGANGLAISLVSSDEVKHLLKIEKLIKNKIVRQEIEGFEPIHTVPEKISIKSGKSTKPRSRKKKFNSKNVSKSGSNAYKSKTSASKRKATVTKSSANTKAKSKQVFTQKNSKKRVTKR